MRVLRLHDRRDLRLHDEPVPEAAPGESLVRVVSVGLCGSDVHWLVEGGIGSQFLDAPMVLGHEFAGVIKSGAREGERVAVDPAIACGNCEFCLEGNPNFCTSLRFPGPGGYDGALQEYVVWPTRFLHLLPDSLSTADGAMLEPLGVAIHAVDLGHLKPGMMVGVFGCGPIGLLSIQVARAAGAITVFATDLLESRLEAAQSLGATDVFLAGEGTEAAAILAATDGRGVDVAIEAAGTNDAVEVAMAVAKPGARVVLVGIPTVDRTTFTASAARRKGLTIMMTRRMKHTYPRAIRMVQEDMVDVRSIVTHVYPLGEYRQAFSIAERREGLKVVIEP
ncbi:MAG: zinc-binding dehydrogenase [Chloroflexota bacterium]